MVKDVLADTAKKMKASADHFRKEIGMLRTGRANISIFEEIKVSYYGVMTPVNQVATLKVPEPTLIVIQPYDPSVLEAVDKAIRGADLGLNPLNDGKLLRVPIPPLDEERRREIAKKIGPAQHAPGGQGVHRGAGEREGDHRGRQVLRYRTAPEAPRRYGCQGRGVGRG
jgi:ribosome recycling factor